MDKECFEKRSEYPHNGVSLERERQSSPGGGYGKEELQATSTD